MVVRVENTKSSSMKSNKKYVGNELNIHLTENYATVSITGNDCRVKIGVNNGVLKIVGNSCHIEVSSGNGDIVYTGNDGRVKLGVQMDEKSVTYIGNGGKVFKEVHTNKDNTKAVKENKKMCSSCKKGCVKEIPIRNIKKNGNYTINIDNASHKHFSISDSVLSFTIPSVIVVPQVTETVIKIQKTKK